MNDVLTIKSLVSLALEHEADFEVFHGVTTHADKRVRAQMVLSMEGCPDVRLAFGDKKHDQRLSSISLAANDKVKVKKEHLLKALERNSAHAHWKRVMKSDSNVTNIDVFGANNDISVTGKVVGSPKLVTDETGFYHWHEYEIVIENKAFMPSTQEVVTLEPTTFFANIPVPRGQEASYEEGTELNLRGEYVFPDHIDVRSLMRTA